MLRLTVSILLLLNSLFASDFVDLSFTDYVRFVSNTSKMNIVVDESLDTKFDVILPYDYKDQDTQNVFQAVLKKNKFELHKYGTIYYIRKMDDLPHFHSIKTAYVLPDVVLTVAKQYFPTIVFSKSKKSIIYYSTESQSDDIFKLVNMLDQLTKSKKIKIQMISFNDSDLEQYGLQLETKFSQNNGNNLSYVNLIKDLTVSQNLLLTLGSAQLNFYIDDLKSKSLIDSKFSPILSLFDNKETKLNITTNIPYLSQSQSVNGSNSINANNYTYKDVGTTINVDNVSINDDSIYFHIAMQYELILDQTITPTTSKRSIDNFINLKNGQTLMIAGIKDDQNRFTHSEIPILAQIPYIGNLFKWVSKSRNGTTFAIFISNVENNTTLESAKINQADIKIN